MAITNERTGTLNLHNSIKVDDQIIKSQTATIDLTNPTKVDIQTWNGSLENFDETYKKNRVSIRNEMANFEDYAYEVQDKIIAEQQRNLEE